MPKRHGSAKKRDNLTIVFRPNSDLKQKLHTYAMVHNRTMNGQVLSILEGFFKEKEQHDSV